MLGIDALTAYLATSPGAMETVAIIAASSPVDCCHREAAFGRTTQLETVRIERAMKFIA